MLTTAVEVPSLRYRWNPREHGTHAVILRCMPPTTVDVLDVGCASGYLGAALAARGLRVWGIDRDADAAERARGTYEDVRVADLEDVAALPWPHRRFDAVVAADVLEHLRDPQPLLEALHARLRPGGVLVASFPNVAHVSVRLPLLFGRFEYSDAGILDRTHYRLFTFATARELVERAGFAVECELSGSDRLGRLLSIRAGRVLRGLLAYGIVLVAVRRG